MATQLAVAPGRQPSLIDKPAIEFNRDKMEKFLPELQKTYYDPTRCKTYLQQLEIQYPTLKK